MAFSFALDPAEPQNTDLVSAGAAEIRLVKDALIERIESFFDDVENDPWEVADGATFLGTADFVGLVTASAGIATTTGDFTGALVEIRNDTPRLRIRDNNGTVNQRVVDWTYNAATLILEARLDNVTFVRNIAVFGFDGSLTMTAGISSTTIALSGTSTSPVVATQTGTGAIGLRIIRSAGTVSDWTFNAAAGSSGLTLVSGAGIAFTLTAAGALTIPSSLTVQANGITVTGASTITDATGADQLTLQYDGSNRLHIKVGSNGLTQYDAVGAGAEHVFSDNIRTGGGLYIEGNEPTVAAGSIGLGSNTQSTVGAAGGASALPVTPTGYWIINVAGVDQVVPYYDTV